MIPMKTVLLTFHRPLLLVTMLALAGCVSTPPPVSELSSAEQSIARAVSVNADQYANAEISHARSLLTQAQNTMAGGQNDQASQLARRAAASADLATARSRSAAALTTLNQRRSEVATLRQRLQQESLP